jgi:tRNA threonylcarbamoyladenosine biosynthesis protein TsaB
MIVLGIDTSGYANAVGVVESNQVLADFNFEARTDSLEKIVTNIDFVLREAGLGLEDVAGFGVGLGPGSWTGIRVGVTVGKILAYSLSRPVAGVPTLEALAYHARNTPNLICPIIYAGAREMVYAGFYRSKDGSISREGEYYVGDIQGLARMVRKPTVFVGAEARAYSQLISQALGSSESITAIEGVPNGAAVALLAQARLERGDRDDVLSLTPLYLKESTAKAFVNKYSRIARTKG